MNSKSNSNSLFQSAWIVLLCLLSFSAAQQQRQSGTSTRNGGNTRGGRGLRYSDQTFIGTHNALMVRTSSNGFSVFGNQFHDVTAQLQGGIRMIQGQGHRNLEDGQIHMCHTDCKFIDAGPLVNNLREIKTWLDQNPTEIVTLLWTNGFDDVPVAQWDSVYQQSGLAAMSYIPPRQNIALREWPLISDMVAANKRVVTFLSDGANENQFPYLLNEFNYVAETAFDVVNVNNFNCNQDRGNGQARNSLTVVNHFLGTDLGGGVVAPNVSYAKVSNSVGPGVGNLLDHANLCTTEHGHKPNFLLIDFFDRGNPLQTADQLNQGIAVPSRTTPPKIAGTDGSEPPPVALSGASHEDFLWPLYLLCLVGSGMILL